jgi:hypothetical protein
MDMTKQQQIELPMEELREIPVRPSVKAARIVSSAMLLLLVLGSGVVLWVPQALTDLLRRNGGVDALVRANGLDITLYVMLQLMGVAGVVCGVSGLVSLWRSRLTYSLLRASLAVSFPLLAGYVMLVWYAVFMVLEAGLEVDGVKLDKVTTVLWWWSACWPALALILYAAWLHVMLLRRSVVAAFTRLEGGVLQGDRILEDFRTHGSDPRYRKSLYFSVMTHFLIIIVIPALMQLGGCVEAYKVPKGSGNPVVAMVKMTKPQKKKKKSMTLRPNSAIIFEVPDLDNTEVDQVMDEQTQVQYQALANAKAGKMGKGGGSQGGWPEGMDDYKIRFIRLDHGGAGWDDGMDDSGSDINFLRAFSQNTGFKNIASKSESHAVRLLAKYPKAGFPPFVYMTGNGQMGNVSTADQKILREYCLKGGMLIADAGSAAFHNSFTHFIRQVFPDKPLIDIADDDILYQLPYGFPNGAPAFWHHGGRRALGIKNEGRWVVFYHPGDMNDAWKSQGYTDVTPEMRDAAMQLGINLVYYAFNQWNDAVAKIKK